MRLVQLKTAVVTVLCITSSRAIDPQHSGSPPIKIGVIGPLTGRAQMFGQIHKRSIDLAIKELNQKQPPGVKGRNIELVFEDDQSDPARSKQAVEKLAADPDVLAILGPVNSSCAQADLQAAQKRKLPLITSLVTRTDLTDEEAKIAQKSPKEPRYFFQTAVSDRVRADALVNFIKRQMHQDNIASLKIFVERDSYGEGLRLDFDQLLKQSDARPQVSYGAYDPGFGDAEQPKKDKETRTIQEELRNFVIQDRTNWIGVFGLTTDFMEIARITKELGLLRHVQFFSIETPPPRLVGTGLPEGTLVFSVFNPDDSRSELTAFKDEYIRANPSEGEPRAAEIFAYSSMRLLAHAMEESAPLSRRSLAIKLQQLTSRGPEGEVARFEFDNFRNVSAVHELWVSQGQFVTRRPGPIGIFRRFLTPLVLVLVTVAVIIFAVRKHLPPKVSAPVLVLVIALAAVVSGLVVLWRLDLLVIFFTSFAFQVAAFILAILAIIFGSIQFWDAREHSAQIRRVAKSMSTRYIGMFPKNMDDIVEVVRLADRELLIMCDFIDYGSYSRPEIHQVLFEELKKARERNVSVKCLVYGVKLAQETLASQFKESTFAQTRESPAFKHYFEYWSGIKPRDRKAGFTYDEFLEILRQNQDRFADDLLDKGVEIQTLSERTLFFFWLQDNQDAVLQFEDIGNAEQGLAFRTLDAKLVETFSGVFGRLWRVCPLLEKARVAS